MISPGFDALGRGERLDILGRRSWSRSIDALGIAGADRDLVHIDVGRVEQAALLGDRQHGERVGAGLGGDRGAFERIERDVDLRALADRRADLLADIEHRRLVALALADHDGAVHIELVERGAHRLDGGGIGRLLVAAPDQRRGGDRRGFGDAHHFEHENAVEDVAGFGHRRLSCYQAGDRRRL